ncbi:hypothetical protein [Desulfotomaculum sp. 1211_IL3151]|uniref:hypothetical protein n=1 Tax=Desulfotomaculum sp. 1211_IL3151 TaxID=3084055 RepID=UPI002FDA53CB
MNIYKIADLTVALQANGETLQKQTLAYLSDPTRPVDISITLTEDFLLQKQGENPHLSPNECEYIWTGAEFYHRLLDFDGFVLHSSAVAYGGQAYLFSAPCGTGKSTHASQWQAYFGEDKAVIINDDKPAIRLIDQHFYVYGTPWSGKSPHNTNIKVPLQAICFLEQSANNWLAKIAAKDALRLILNQTLRPHNIQHMDKLLYLLDRLLRQIPIYKMGCNISEQAVIMAYQAMSAKRKGEKN